jgi:hypothetical protein
MTEVDAGPSHSPTPIMGVLWLFDTVHDDTQNSSLIGPEHGGHHLHRRILKRP